MTTNVEKTRQEDSSKGKKQETPESSQSQSQSQSNDENLNSNSNHQKRRVKWVGLKERDSLDLEDDYFPSSSNSSSNSSNLIQQGKNSFNPDHSNQNNRLNYKNSLLKPRPSSINLPKPPTLQQLNQQITAQNLKSSNYYNQKNSVSPQNISNSSLDLSTHQNTRANSNSCSNHLSNSINPYFPTISPHPNSIINLQLSSNSTPNQKKLVHLRSNSSSALDHSISDSSELHPPLLMSTPDNSRPTTPISDLDIPFGERDGLPSDPNRKPRTFTREAANLVSLHKYNISARARKSLNPTGQTTSGKKLGTAASYNATIREQRHFGAGLGIASSSSSSSGIRSGFIGAGLSVGNGVLSSLLHLYNHPPSAQSSSATLINYGSDDGSDANGEGSQCAFSHTMHSHSDHNDSRENDTGNQLQQVETLVNQQNNSSITPQTTQVNSFNPKKRIIDTLSKVARKFDRERPAGARSKAGVFGALQASAIGLGGVAAPAATTVAPAVEKSGYRLARYTPTTIEPPDTSLPFTPGLNLTSDDPYGEMTQVANMQDVYLGNHLRRSTSAGVLVGESSSVKMNTRQDPALFNTGNFEPNLTSGSLLTSSSSSSALNQKNRLHRSSSKASLKALGEAIKPAKFHNESAILKAKRAYASPASGSTPGTPNREFPYSEKTPVATPIGLPPHLYNSYTSKVNQPNYMARKRREKRRQEEIFITMHVAAILQRQQFILQLTRALMMFGGPSHRLESQILATARVLEIDLQVVLIFSVCIFSFQDEATHTSETKFIKQSPNVDLGKLTDLATLHWEVVHDKIGVQEASQEISKLMRDPPEYKNWQTVLIGAMCSMFIGPAAFNSSFLDVLISAPLGAGLVAAQLFVANKSDVLSQIFEIVATGLVSFIAAGLAYTGYFCDSAIIASSVVLILPGWLVCCAALELQSRSIVSGSVRLIWAIIYALFLGIGISVGAEIWTLVSGKPVLVGVDGTCSISHSYDKWYRRTIPAWSAFLVVPAYALFLAMRQQARLNSKEIWVMVILASGGYTANHFASIAFPNRAEISSALGSFVVGFLANLYGRLFQGTSFIVALVPILFQLPSGLANGGLLYFANTLDSKHSFLAGFQVGQQLLEVSLGLVLGLFVATVLVYPFGNRRGGLMAF